MKKEHTNALINETSPYLLQHAHNPVDWMPWGDEALLKAKTENKPLLISIGYSACHWCHIMEHESFEDEAAAEAMNAHFVCIKVDREERPDVDQVYMDAVQLMTGSGGWPLNCFALPDGRPFYGGTYFRKEQWLQVLDQLSSMYESDPEKVIEYAEKLTEGLTQMDQVPLVTVPTEFDKEVLETTIARWKKSFDYQEGGPNRAPKFPMPNNYQFLLAYAVQFKDKDLLDYVDLTLEKMAFGGIYDQLGGGFSRYSTDALWKAPHFEKMLYDNGQLLSLYSQAYQQSKNPIYLQVINETANWIKAEMTSPEGAFYSALDADSEGEEGKFYVWKKEEIEGLSGECFELVADYYNVNKAGYWEHDNYILLRSESDKSFAAKKEISEEKLQSTIAEFKEKALEARSLRIRPGLDDKCLTSWNALASKGLIDAYVATGNQEFLELANRNLAFILGKQMAPDGRLNHSYKNGRSTINGYLEDYSLLIDVLLRHYEVTFDAQSMVHIKTLLEYVFNNFDRNEAGFFYFKSKLDAPLVAKKVELTDNVIPASNSILATACFKLGLLLADNDLVDLSNGMLAQVQNNFAPYPAGYSQWMLLYQYVSTPYYEVAIVGNDCLKKLATMQASYVPNAVFCGGKDEGNLPVLEHKLIDNKTLIYVCQHGACQVPVDDAEAALRQLR